MGLLAEIFEPNGSPRRYAKDTLTTAFTKPPVYDKGDLFGKPTQYAEGASKWQPYQGPRGGRGWRHSESGQVVYQTERPGEESSPKPPESAGNAPKEKETPKPAPAGASAWQPIKGPNGEDLWQHKQTGEIVKSKAAPSSAGTASVLDQARQKTPPKITPSSGVKPSAQPKTQGQPPIGGQNDPPIIPKVGSTLEGGITPPKTPQIDPKALDGLPVGTNLFGWKKEAPPGLDMSIWTNGEQALGNGQFLEQHRSPEQQAQIQAALKATPKPAAQPAQGKPAQRPLTPHEEQDIAIVGRMFGAAPGDIGNQRQMELFLRRTARYAGFDPDSVQGDRTDKAAACAKFLQSRGPHLESIVQMAKGYGWGGGSARELSQRARHAGLHLIKTAQQAGYQPQGESEQEHLSGAMEFLRQREAQRPPTQPQSLQPITQAFQALLSKVSRPGGKRSTFWDIAMAAIGFYAGYKLMRMLRRRAGRR